MKKAIKTTLAFTMLLTIFAINLAYGGESEAISMVKKKVSCYGACTIEDIVNATIKKPKWKQTRL